MRFGTLSLLFVTLAVNPGCATHGAQTATPERASLALAAAPGAVRGDSTTGSSAVRPGGRSTTRQISRPIPAAESVASAPTRAVSVPASAPESVAATTRSTTAASSTPVGTARVTPALGLSGEGPRVGTPRPLANPADVSGVWIWEHRGPVPTGDEKQEREEWHVDQQGDRISGYYDRVVREISTDGHAFRCSMGLEFEIATRYRIRGEVRGNQVLIYESSFEVLEPSACDNGQRRLDAYEGLASDDEVRLAWGVGAQVLRRPRPDVPTQHF